MKCKFLSHQLAEEMPVYGSSAAIDIKPVKAIVRGDSSNVYSMTLQNHWGTHVDCPAHFFQNGLKIKDFDADFWLFIKPQIIPVRAEPGKIISENDLPMKIKSDTDFLILKSGWGKFRGDPVYYERNPGIDPSFGQMLRRNYPYIRAVGMDWISLSSYENREIGREAHKVFLNPTAEGNPIMIVEDMNLPDDIEELNSVYIAPMRFEGIDSAPCTIIGFLT